MEYLRKNCSTKDASTVYRREKVKEKMIMFTRAVVEVILLVSVMEYVVLINALRLWPKAAAES
jgi:hypothetical protein